MAHKLYMNADQPMVESHHGEAPDVKLGDFVKLVNNEWTTVTEADAEGKVVSEIGVESEPLRKQRQKKAKDEPTFRARQKVHVAILPGKVEAVQEALK